MRHIYVCTREVIFGGLVYFEVILGLIIHRNIGLNFIYYHLRYCAFFTFHVVVLSWDRGHHVLARYTILLAI